MHAVSSRRAGDVKTIVDEQTSRTLARDFYATTDEFIKHTRWQVFFADLKERDLDGDGNLNPAEDSCEL